MASPPFSITFAPRSTSRWRKPAAPISPTSRGSWFSRGGPRRVAAASRRRHHPLVHEAPDAPVVSLADVQVALRIRGHAMRTKHLPRPGTLLAEFPDDLEIGTAQNPDLMVRSILQL